MYVCSNVHMQASPPSCVRVHGGSCWNATLLIVNKCLVTYVFYMQQDGWTALIWASAKGHLAVSDELIKHNADISAQDNVRYLLFRVCVCVCTVTAKYMHSAYTQCSYYRHVIQLAL